ncbi:MAG: phosphatase PAP2 family protein [Actinobacteria bacterium]|nr:phosphatase PAP2 family protein [Actinomycetota bacterium]
MLLAAASIAVGLASSTPEGRRADDEAFRAVNSAHDPGRDRFFAGITELGSIYASIGAALALAATGRRRTAGRAIGAACVTWTAGQLLKKVFMRPRPYDAMDDARLMIGKPNGTSWPSSHPAVILTFVTVAGRDLRLPRIARGLLFLAAGCVAVSRSYLGVHYPSDTIGGVLMGRAVGVAWPADEG